MMRIKIELPGGQAIYLGVPEGTRVEASSAPPTKPANPEPQKPTYQKPPQEKSKEGKQLKLYNELSAYCNNNKFEMEKVMRKISEWKGKSKTVKDIADLSDGRAGATLRNLREMVKAQAQPSPQEEKPQPGAFEEKPDDDIPF